MPGCHLEGPYISGEDGPRGAHPREHVRPPDWDEFEKLQQASGGRIRLVTLAPELPGAIDFIRRAVASGVTVAIGHTAAAGTEIAAAVEAGAAEHPPGKWCAPHAPPASELHLGTARRPAFVGERDRRRSSFSPFGPAVDHSHQGRSWRDSDLRRGGPRRLPTGVYTEGDMRMEVLEDGRIVVAGQRQFLAGSGADTGRCVVEAMQQAGVSLAEAFDMAGRNPARLLGFRGDSLAAGLASRPVLFRITELNSLDIQATVAAGTLQFGTIASP